MGLDGVEIVMSVEDRFNVSLPDYECSRVRTVADLAALVISRLPRQSGVCATARAFYEVRKLMTAQGGLARGLIRPRTRLDELFPAGTRESWKALREHDRRLPALTRSPGADATLLWVSALVAFAWFFGSAALAGRFGIVTALPIALGALLVGIGALAALGSRFAKHFPPGIETIGDVASVIAPVAWSGNRLLTELRVLNEVRKLTAEQLGLPLDKVLPDSNFVKDLKCG